MHRGVDEPDTPTFDAINEKLKEANEEEELTFLAEELEQAFREVLQKGYHEGRKDEYEVMLRE